MCVIMLDIMKTATIREIQHNLSEVLSWVERGEEVQVLRRNKVVARLLPPQPQPSQSPDFVARARAVWGDGSRGTALSAIVSESRGER
jgi:antitoxin (DNA-binding transcriptional repressor) of toxin-antitoxin stability system